LLLCVYCVISNASIGYAATNNGFMWFHMVLLYQWFHMVAQAMAHYGFI